MSKYEEESDKKYEIVPYSAVDYNTKTPELGILQTGQWVVGPSQETLEEAREFAATVALEVMEVMKHAAIAYIKQKGWKVAK